MEVEAICEKWEVSRLEITLRLFQRSGETVVAESPPYWGGSILTPPCIEAQSREVLPYQGATGVVIIVEFPHLLTTNANPASQTDPNCSIKLLLMLQRTLLTIYRMAN